MGCSDHEGGGRRAFVQGVAAGFTLLLGCSEGDDEASTGSGPSHGSTGAATTTDGTSGTDPGSSSRDGGTTDPGGSRADTTGASGGCPDGATAMHISMDHGHAATIPAAAIEAGTQMSFTVEDAGAGHEHVLTLSEANVGALAAGSSIAVETDDDDTGHTHVITLTCT